MLVQQSHELLLDFATDLYPFRHHIHEWSSKMDHKCAMCKNFVIDETSTGFCSVWMDINISGKMFIYLILDLSLWLFRIMMAHWPLRHNSVHDHPMESTSMRKWHLFQIRTLDGDGGLYFQTCLALLMTYVIIYNTNFGTDYKNLFATLQFLQSNY